MLTWIIQISIISIIFIFLVHHLLMFFKSTLTVPKIKDLVNSPNQKYQNIYDTILHNSTNTNNYNNSNNSNNSNYSPSYTDIDLLPITNSNQIEDQTSMKDELKSFLKKQLNNDSNNSNNNSINQVIGMDPISGNYSTF